MVTNLFNVGGQAVNFLPFSLNSMSFSVLNPRSMRYKMRTYHSCTMYLNKHTFSLKVASLCCTRFSSAHPFSLYKVSKCVPLFLKAPLSFNNACYPVFVVSH